MLSVLQLALALLVLAPLSTAVLPAGTGSRLRKKVVIAGAGPAGLLVAHSLLSRYKDGDYLYDVTICERLGDPRSELAGPRAYSLGLNIRGQKAIKTFDTPGKSFGLWHAIAREGVFSEEFWIHIGKLKIPIRKKAKPSRRLQPPPTLMVPRNRLVSALVSHGEAMFGSERFDVRYNTTVADLAINDNTAILSTGERVKYDLALGCDGVYSSIRSAMDKQLPPDDGFSSEEVVLPGSYKVLLQNRPPLLEAGAIHALECTNKNRSGFSLFVIPAPNDKICALVNWKNATAIPDVLQNGSVEDVQKALASDFPLFGVPEAAAVQQLFSQRPSVALTVQCSQYAAPSRGVALMGDAAHSTGGTLGQGANSALLDVVALTECLDASNDDIPAALAQFSARQAPEGKSLFKLLALPPKGPLGLIFQLDQLIRGLLSKFLPFVWLPAQVALSQTLTPFTRVVRQNALWVWIAGMQRKAAANKK